MVERVHRESTPKAKTRISGMIKDALKRKLSFFSLEHEFRTAAHLMHKGFDVYFGDVHHNKALTPRRQLVDNLPRWRKLKLPVIVDDLLASDKELAGEVFWGDGTREETKRLEWPVLVNCESKDCALTAGAYPEFPHLRFTLCLNFRDFNIWRVDWNPLSSHTNPIKKGHPYSGRTQTGPHCHPWDINRHEATPATIPSPLQWARPLPDGPRSWESTFRWFLDETNIGQPRTIPDLPLKEKFI